jgi:hypothetical protein
VRRRAGRRRARLGEDTVGRFQDVVCVWSAMPCTLSMDRSRASVDASAPLRATEQGPDVLVDLEDIAALGGWLDIEHVEPPVQELIDGGARARVAPLIHLVEESRAGLLGVARGIRTGRNYLGEVVSALRQRVDPAVHPDAQGTAKLVL